MKKSNPLKNMPKEISPAGDFGAIRKFDIHTGVDLYCKENDDVFAIEDGQVKKVALFTGGGESPWWNDTDYIGVLGESGFIVYGEVSSLVREGETVLKGDVIGRVKRVLKQDKGTPVTMLHLELYTKECDPVIWKLGSPVPENLLDPKVLFKK